MESANLEFLLDRQLIIDTIIRFATAFDLQDWPMLRACLADEIQIDYSDFRGEPPATVSADDYVASRRRSLSSLKTQHLSANHLVTIEGATAVCTSTAVIFRYSPGQEIENKFDTHCYYTHRLRKVDSAWKISEIVQKVLWSTGNPQLHGLVPPSTSSIEPHTVSLSDQTIACLEFFPRWETPLDLEAVKTWRRLRMAVPDFASFQQLAPAGSADRQLVERLWASFEEAGRLIRAGQMRADLFLDNWYELPRSWHTAKTYVVGMRAEQHNPLLYQNFEWLAARAEQFWLERERNPPQWQPLAYSEPTPEDRAIFETFDRHTPRPVTAWALLADLREHAPTFEAFQMAAPMSSSEFVTLDLILCAYDRAGVLTKNGIIHPALLFGTWHSPADLWAETETWIKGLQQANNSPHLYENVEWLAEFEPQWRNLAAR